MDSDESMSKIFFPFIHPSQLTLVVSKLILGFEQDKKCLMPKLVNRKETKYEKMLESLVYAMTSFVRSVEFDAKMSGEGSATDSAAKIKQRLMNELISPCIVKTDQWITTTDKHESRGATSYLTLSGGAGFFKLSFDFQGSQ